MPSQEPMSDSSFLTITQDSVTSHASDPTPAESEPVFEESDNIQVRYYLSGLNVI